MTWQPLEMAPESTWADGPTDVLVWGPGIGVREGRVCKRPDGTVFAGLPNVNGNVAGDYVTHWMPLPEPPQ